LVIVENNFCSVIICRQSRYYVVLANVTVMSSDNYQQTRQ